MTKTQLLEMMNGVRAAFLYGYFVDALAHKKADVASEARIGGTFNFQANDDACGLGLEMLATFLSEDGGKVIRGNYYLFLEYQAIRIFYELMFTYCEQTGQLEKYGAEPWLQFARVMRHVVSHGEGAVLAAWPKSLRDKGITEVKWRNRTLREGQLGEYVHINVVDIIKLNEDIFMFCRDKLT
jgi:hypothetical protein